MRMPLNQIPGVRASITVPSGWGGGSERPCRSCSAAPEYADLVQWRDLLMQRMEENPGLTNVAVELRGTQAAAARRRRSQPRRRPRRVAADRRAHARDHAGFAHRHDVHRPRPRVQRDPAGPRRGPRDAHRPRQPLRALGSHAASWCRCRTWCSSPRLARPSRLNRFDRLRSITVSAALDAGLHARRGARLRRGRRRARRCRRRVS